MDQVYYLHGINLLPQFGPARLGRLWKLFRNWEKAFKASPGELAKTGIETDILNIFLAHRQTVNLEMEMQKLEAEGIKLLSAQDSNYPQLLLEIPHYPPLLYYKGRMDIPDELCIAVVGTRKITNYGRTVGPSIIQPLIEAGVTVVSGLAYGVDSQMQQLAVKARRRTIAILGGGLDDKSFYPKQHLYLAQEILNNRGAIISEYPPGTPPLKQNFVLRNRIIAGMCVGTVIIECALKSGSLITARVALDQNRTVYAVPGSVYNEMSKGPNNLIKMGAKAITEADDILDDLNLKPAKRKLQAPAVGDNEVETRILQQLSLEPMLIDDIIKQTALDASDVTAALVFLEIKGKVRNLGAQQYIRRR
jgi:DNA processing protein